MVVVAVGAVLPILMPQSRAMLWASALVVGVGAACLFASLIAQMQRHVQVTGSVCVLFTQCAIFALLSRVRSDAAQPPWKPASLEPCMRDRRILFPSDPPVQAALFLPHI